MIFEPIKLASYKEMYEQAVEVNKILAKKWDDETVAAALKVMEHLTADLMEQANEERKIDEMFEKLREARKHDRETDNGTE